MTCVAVATSPVLAACLSPSMRHRDDPSIFGGVQQPSQQLVNCLDLLPSSPLLYAGPKLCPFLSSSRKCSPSHSSSSMPPPPSPRIQCSPRTPSSWTPPIGTPSGRAVCGCGALSVYSSCSCSVASASSPSDIKWRPTSLEKRFNLEAQPDVKYGLSSVPNVESPSPRVSGSSPISRFSRAMPPPLVLPPEAPSPRFGGSHPVFTSPRVLSARPSSAASSNNPRHLAVLVNKYESRLEGNRNSSTGGPSFPISRSSTEEDLVAKLQLDIRSDRAAVVSEETESLSVNSSSVSTDVAAPAEIGGLNVRPISPPLKRKRPPKLEIPTGGPTVLPSAFPHLVDLAEEAVNEMTVDGLYYGISCKKGRRETLEDTHRAVPSLRGDPGQAFFGVFDGHGGREAADFAAENLVDKIVDAIESSQGGEGSIEAAVRAGYLATDAAFLEQRLGSGASCVTALIKDGHAVVTNAGDCRAVLSRAGTAEALTNDHRAGREDERERIESLGGFVDNLTGTWRVQGTLAVSRGIGDLHLKEWISAEPEIQKLPITPDCEFLILASDGLWDAVTNQEAVDAARAVLQPERKEVEVMDLQIPLAMASSSLTKEGEELVVATGDQCEGIQNMDQKKSEQVSEMQEMKTNVLSTTDDDKLNISAADMPIVGFPEPLLPSAGTAAACKKLVEMSIKRGCHDDITVMIVDLRHFQRLSYLPRLV